MKVRAIEARQSSDQACRTIIEGTWTAMGSVATVCIACAAAPHHVAEEGCEASHCRVVEDHRAWKCKRIADLVLEQIAQFNLAE